MWNETNTLRFIWKSWSITMSNRSCYKDTPNVFFVVLLFMCHSLVFFKENRQKKTVHHIFIMGQETNPVHRVYSFFAFMSVDNCWCACVCVCVYYARVRFNVHLYGSHFNDLPSISVQIDNDLFYVNVVGCEAATIIASSRLFSERMKRTYAVTLPHSFLDTASSNMSHKQCLRPRLLPCYFSYNI